MKLAITTALAALLLGAPAAQAGGNFERGFENELGRIAAREVVRIGKFVLTGGHGFYYDHRWAAAYPAPGYEARPIGPYYPPAAYRGHRPWPPAYPAAARPEPGYAPPRHVEPCASDHEPYQERIVWERYERVIDRGPRRDDYEREIRY